eukprot:1838556-Prymnesium_polylepis.1
MPTQTAEEGGTHSGSAGATTADAGREGLGEGTRIRADETGVLTCERQSITGGSVAAGDTFSRR